MPEYIKSFMVDPGPGDVLLACQDLEGCLIGDDGVGRCAAGLPKCDRNDTSTALEFLALGQCADPGGATTTVQVLGCGGYTPAQSDRGTTALALACPADTCGIGCAGLPDGASCRPRIIRDSYLVDGAFDLNQDLVCGPFSACDATGHCAPRTCDSNGPHGACTNAGDCARLNGHLASALGQAIDCFAESDPQACVAAALGISSACAACWVNLQGDFAACAGF